MEISAHQSLEIPGAGIPSPSPLPAVPQPERSWLERLADAFLQERNIQWLLGLGMVILLGSSTMLVTSHWHAYPPLGKYAVLVGYTLLIHLAGQAAWHWLGLRKTGTGLMVLTVLLIPVVFLALRWVQPEGELSWSTLGTQSGLLALLGVNTFFSLFAARRIFRHLLRKDQFTFLASYLLLSLGGAFAHLVPTTLAPVAALLLWGLFCIGAVKVNRHVFWLAEEHRLPRVCGFLPILLLGGQFLLVLCTSLLPHLTWGSLGLGLVLTAIPILLTSDALARVVEQRGASPDGRLPAGIAIPLFLGIALAPAGVILSGLEFPRSTLLVPTAALAAVVMGVAARRTRSQVLVWLMLGLLLTAYQTSPVFFKELARSAVQAGAAAVQEQRLPLAFYGVTYLPFILLTAGASAWLTRRGEALFAPAMSRCSIGLTTLLLGVSWSHPKAPFLVGLVLASTYLSHLFLIRDGRLLWCAVIAALSGLCGALAFVTQVWQIALPLDGVLAIWLAAAAGLFVAGHWLDAAAMRMNPSSRWPVCQLASALITVLAAIIWILFSLQLPVSPLVGTAIAGGLWLHTSRWRTQWLALLTLTYAALMSLVMATQFGATWASTLLVLNTEFLVLAGWQLWHGGRPTSLATLFRNAGAIVAHWGLLVTQLLLLVWTAAGLGSLSPFTGSTAGWLALLAAALLLLRFPARDLVITSWLLACSLVTTWWQPSFLEGLAIDRLPVVWSGMALATLLTTRLCKVGVSRSLTLSRNLQMLEKCAAATALLLAVGSLPMLGGSWRLAAALSLTAAGVWFQQWPLPWREALLLVVNLQVLTTAIAVGLPGANSLADLTLTSYRPLAMPVALIAAISCACWTRRDLRRPDLLMSSEVQMLVLSVVSMVTLCWIPGAYLSVLEVCLASISFLILAGTQVAWGLRTYAVPIADEQQPLTPDLGEQHIWVAEIFVGAGLAYLSWFEAVPLTSTLALFMPLTLAVGAWIVSQFVRSRGAWQVLQRPLGLTAEWLPLGSVLLGIYRHSSLPAGIGDWLGLNSLALLLAAGYYFWRGLEHRRPGLLTMSAVILNVSLALLWRELQLTDPQFFLVPVGLSIIGLVELLREQVPQPLHDPLRYIGALAILVSPTFEIVAGSWLHMASLMAASVLVALLAIALRVRALMYAGTAFLLADLAAMVVRSTIDHPARLWITGVLLGAAVIALAAWCERNREQMLQRLRQLAARLETWN